MLLDSIITYFPSLFFHIVTFSVDALVQAANRFFKTISTEVGPMISQSCLNLMCRCCTVMRLQQSYLKTFLASCMCVVIVMCVCVGTVLGVCGGGVLCVWSGTRVCRVLCLLRYCVGILTLNNGMVFIYIQSLCTAMV
jgi:hypothetical protein